ncbi:MAG: M28 family peptidase [candidate division Zixibacteria bacterium]|nr:M28 family peptidase [candidate division Zixibacteria bacterium]
MQRLILVSVVALTCGVGIAAGEPSGDPAVSYSDAPTLAGAEPQTELGLLLDAVNTDLLYGYVLRLQNIGHRLTGTCAGRRACDWIEGDFISFDYDSIECYQFEGRQLPEMTPCKSFNLVITKPGLVCPEKQILICAHYDGLPYVAAADDNASGVAAIEEIGRILQSVETKLTLVFAAFDSEESGQRGAQFYVDSAVARGDDIVAMINLDMIGHWDNDLFANLYCGADTTYAVVWRELADSLFGMEGRMSGIAEGDHIPFLEAGYDVVFVREGTLSTNQHLVTDSIAYMNFDYMTRMVKTTLAAVLAIDAMATAQPSLDFEYFEGRPFVLRPDAATRLRFDIDGLWAGELAPGTVELHYAIDGGPYVSVPASHLTDNRYEVFLPAIACDSRLDYYLSAGESTEGGTVLDPGSLQTYTSFGAWDTLEVFADDFSDPTGWEVGGDALDGDWERGVPAGNGLAGDPRSDYDGSGYCFLTGNRLTDADVDWGMTSLTSPPFDLSGDAIVRYARWLANNKGDNPHEDVMQVSIRDGAGWVAVETVGPVDAADGGWFEYAFRVSDFATPAPGMRVRFEVSDEAAISTVEAALDAFQVVRLDCDAEADPDGDGYGHTSDNCPFTYNPDQIDADGDGAGDACDACANDALDDFDGDGWCADVDNCPSLRNPVQRDYDADGAGDLCDACTDFDGDGFGDPGFESNSCPVDNCPMVSNPDQKDADGDGIGDACCCAGIRGDVNMALPGRVNISDIAYLVTYLFGIPPGPPPPCPAEANANGDASENVNISDITYLVDYLFGIPLGPEPPACP